MLIPSLLVFNFSKDLGRKRLLVLVREAGDFGDGSFKQFIHSPKPIRLSKQNHPWRALKRGFFLLMT